MDTKTVNHFVTFAEHGFPSELIWELEERTGHKIIGNKSSSKAQILDELAEEEIATGHMIVYTSADSALQMFLPGALKEEGDCQRYRKPRGLCGGKFWRSHSRGDAAGVNFVGV